jgi:hypothetical protein
VNCAAYSSVGGIGLIKSICTPFGSELNDVAAYRRAMLDLLRKVVVPLPD